MAPERIDDAVGDVLSSFAKWLGARDGLGEVIVLDPGKAPLPDGISLVVQRLEYGERRHTDAGNPLIEAIVLLLVAGTDSITAATRAGEVLFALHDERWADETGAPRQLRVQPGDSADAARASLGLPPMLALLLRIPIERRRRLQPVRPVLHPLRVQFEELSSLDGVVLGQIEGSQPLPMADARLTAPDYGSSGVSDQQGRFYIAGVPAKGPVALRISTRHQIYDVTTNARTGVVLTLPIAVVGELPKGQ